MATNTDNFLQSFRFRVSSPTRITGVIGFQTVTGLRSETEVIEYREGDDEVIMRKVPGLTSSDTITLERGLDQNSDLEAWRQDVFQVSVRSKIEGDANISSITRPSKTNRSIREDVTIEVFRQGDAEPSRAFLVKNAWPSALEYSDLSAGASEIFVATLELSHEGLVEILATRVGD